MKCIHCKSELKLSFLDLGTAPPSNAYLTEKTLNCMEKHYPLRILVCENCWLVQTENFAYAQELFDADYAYFSGFSSIWLDHCKNYVEAVKKRFVLDEKSHVVEVAANDGCLLQYMKELHIPCTGVEPTASTAHAARAKGIPIIEEFFGVRLAKEMAAKNLSGDIIVANNVLAHVPDINDFVSGFSILLKPHGVATFEFHYLLSLINQSQFDTIYHEHFSYFSLTVVNRIFAQNGLAVFDVEKIPTHGGSLRVFAQKMDSKKHAISSSVYELMEAEEKKGVKSAFFYADFQKKAEKIKDDLLSFLLSAKREGKKIAAYGAAAKGNTLMNYAGIKPDLVSFVVDKNPAKQGKWTPGSRIPIVNEEYLVHKKPDYVLILPWNIKQEITSQLSYISNWGGKFVVAIPHLEIL